MSFDGTVPWHKLSIKQRVLSSLLLLSTLVSGLLMYNEVRLVIGAFPNIGEASQVFFLFLATVVAIVCLPFWARIGGRIALGVSLISLVVLSFGVDLVVSGNREFLVVTSLTSAATAAALLYTMRPGRTPAD
jgi:hypothetical protein